MWDRAQYYDSLAHKVLGRPVKHTLLTHFNLVNGLFLDDLLQMFKSKGWQLIDAEDAFSDRIFRAEPKVVPAGESIVWSLAEGERNHCQDAAVPRRRWRVREREDGQAGIVRMRTPWGSSLPIADNRSRVHSA